MKQHSAPDVARDMMSFALGRSVRTARCSALEQTGIVVPTCNAAPHWESLDRALSRQGLDPEQVLIIDSSSTDGTAQKARHAGYRVVEISRDSFRHGTTRQLAAGYFPQQRFLIYLTQDALPCGDDCFQKLLEYFEDDTIGAAYGRQLPREGAGAIERHGRAFNYPDRAEVRDLHFRDTQGFRAAFFSNSFAAYRRTALEDVGGFPTDTIVSEEVTVAARMLLSGWRIAYHAHATVQHSHDLSISQEFRRYFDIGVHHGRSGWLLDQFGSAGGEGRAFLVSQARYLWQSQASQLPVATLRNLSKYVSYRLGRCERWLPLGVKSALSAQPGFWRDEADRVHKTPELYQPKLS